MSNKIADEDMNPILDAIETAEEIHDPLAALFANAAEDPGSLFKQEVLEQLMSLKAEDRAAFEAVRAKLKKAGFRVKALDEAIAEKNGDGARGSTQADILIDLAASTQPFHTADGTAFVDLSVNDHRETWRVRSKGFSIWLTQQFYEKTGGAPNSEAMKSALNVIEAKAHFDGPERPVFIRVGGLDGRLYLDLCDENWKVVEIDHAGWRVIDKPPIRFRRAAGMLPLKAPVTGGSIEGLRDFLNVQSDQDFVLMVAWTLAALRNNGPYPVLVLSGEQGSAKSTFSAILRSLLDPNSAALRALPRDDRNLFIAASNGHLLAFDNLSGMTEQISDTLCRLSTGGAFAVRQLFTDQDEVLIDAARPMILNGIETSVTRSDLADRALFLTLEPITEERRRSEAELWAAFEAERGRILGALLDAMVEGLKNLPNTKLAKLPRMADFALWASACETAIWPAGTFWSAYCGNRDSAVDDAIDNNPVAAAVRAVMRGRTVWTGTATELLDTLGAIAGERIATSKIWPKSPGALSGQLRRAATFLRRIGIEMSFGREGRARTRIIRISAADTSEPEHGGEQPPAPSVPRSTPLQDSGFTGPDPRTDATGADDRSNEPVDSVRATPLNSNGRTVADDVDANCPTQSEPEETDTTWRTRL